MKKKEFALRSLTLGMVLIAYFCIRVSFLENFTFITPDGTITSFDIIVGLDIIRWTIISFGLLVCVFPQFFLEYKKNIKNLKDKVKNIQKRMPKIFLMSFFLLLCLAGYFSLLFIGDFSFTDKNTIDGDSRLGNILDIFRTIVHFSDSFWAILTTSAVDVDQIDIPIYKLYIREEYIDILNEDLPSSGLEYVEGDLVFNNITYDAKARYRGDSKLHWYFPKKSWRVKLKDDKILNFSDKFNLINPKYKSHMRTQIGYYVADQIELLAPRNHHVALFLNNKYEGLYYYTDQIDESFLRMKGKVPGDIFFGEAHNTSLFASENIWDVKATFDGNSTRAEENMDLFIREVTTNDLNAFHVFFTEHLGDNYLKFYALNIFLGDMHIGNFANHKFYFNPSSGIFEPVVWDQIPFSVPEMHINETQNDLFAQINKIPLLAQQKNKYLYETMNTIPEKQLLAYIDKTMEEIEYEMEHDVYKDSPYPPWVISQKEWKIVVKELKELTHVRYEIMEQELNNTNLKIYFVREETKNNLGTNNFLIIDVNGSVGVKIESITLGTKNEELCITTSQDKNRNYQYDGVGKKQNLCAKGGIINIPLGKYAFYPADNTVLRYIFIVEEVDTFSNRVSEERISVQSVDASNAITNEKIKTTITYLSSKDDLPKFAKTHSTLHPWDIEEKYPQIITLRGHIKIKEDFIVNEQDTLIIEKGTKISFAANTSIISFGPIFANGTVDEPIIFTSPSVWGAIALQGEGADGSTFTYCTFEYGSGTSYGLVHYTGMLSAYNTKITIENSHFKNNKVEDDMINTKFSSVIIRNNTFENSFGDAIDLDFSEGKIEDNSFYNSGNDAIDIMTSNAFIKRNKILTFGDKGISVGEKSKPQIENNHIEGGMMGIAIKDLSDPYIYGNTIINNEVGIAAYQKNWRYGGGGYGTIIATDLCNNEEPLVVTNSSVLLIYQENVIIKKQNETNNDVAPKNRMESIGCTEIKCEISCV